MAITPDTTTDTSAASGGSVNISVGATASFLFVHGIGNTTNTMTAASATANGVAMTQIGTIVIGSNRQFAFGLMNPPTGTVAIVITLVGDATHLSRASTYIGSSITGQPAQFFQDAPVTANLTTGSLTVSADSWLIVGLRGDGAAVTAGAGTTIRTPSTNNIFTADSNVGLPAGSSNLKFNNASQTFEYTLIELQSSGNATLSARRTLQGVGI